jgi:membrane protease YdiL (CAAX protease family)
VPGLKVRAQWYGVCVSHGCGELLWLWAAALLVYPLLEEFVFRQHLLMSLRTWLTTQVAARSGAGPVVGTHALWGINALANTTCSVLFSLSHLPVHGWPGAVSVFLPSLVLGAFFLAHRRLLLNVAVHAYWNGLYLAGGGSGLALLG